VHSVAATIVGTALLVATLLIAALRVLPATTIVGAALLVATLLITGIAARQRVRRATLKRIRLPLRKGHSAVKNRDRSDQTLRPKCNFIHKSHLVPRTAPANSDRQSQRFDLVTTG
jgi:hypothetical protein